MHRALAVALGLWLVLQAATGTVLVFADQINAWLRPDLFRASSGDLGPDAALAAARSVQPEARATAVQMPANQTGVYVVSMLRPGEKPRPFGPARWVYVDPGTGDVNGIRDTDKGFTAFMAHLHGDLLLAHRLGGHGPTIVGWLGVGAGLVVLSGFVTWLRPTARRWATAFRVRRRPQLTRQRDLHRVLGLVLTPFLVLVIVTGVNISFPTEMRRIWYAITPGPDAGSRFAVFAQSPAADPPGRPVPVADAVRAAAAATKGRVQSVGLPAGPKGAYNVRVSDGWDPLRGGRGRGGNVNVFVDQYAGGVLRVQSPSSYGAAAKAYEYWAFPTHIGTAGGAATRLLWLVFGLGFVALAGGGLWIWWLRHRRKVARAAVVRTAMEPLPVQVAAAVARTAELEAVPTGTVVVRQGERADAFYVVLDGDFEVRVTSASGVSAPVRQLGAGASFGEIGLLSEGRMRTATVTALSDGHLLVLPPEDLDRILRRAEADGLDLHAASAAFAAAHLAQDEGGPVPRPRRGTNEEVSPQ